ncbi:uncharacterized protein LOC100212395 [Hydra vulgaris]|uniref:uncharacterized protein LOC100212395 n=1 Tax=Hydra vulgaris TaxID=6087 RepID=UPI0032EA3278
MFYRKSCSENNYIPLSDSSLWKVLHAIKPSNLHLIQLSRKSLAGLDDVTASGMNGFQTLQKLAQRFSSKSLEAPLEKGKRYLKTSYQTNCSVNDSNISSHSSKHALSDPSEKNLQSNTEISEVVCADCYDLCKAIEMIKELTIQNSGDADSIYDLEIAVKDVFNYIKHLMRDSQQKKAKIEAFKQLNNETAFWLKDFCQKILPVRYREGQREYFGKKGMSLHVDIFFIKIAGKLFKRVYFTSMYRCDQGIGDVVSLATEVLDQFRIDQPHIKKMFTKSDNAGCYQGNLSAEAIYNVCKERDIKLLIYDYNEPCCGKDQCDRESAVVKTILRSYVDSGNNLLTAEDIHKAMHYSFGAKDAKVAVAQISNDKTVVTGPKIKNISNYHSFEFGEKSMKMWRYFNIGEGIEQEYGNLKIQPSIKLLLPYSKTDNSIKRNKSLKEKQKRSERQLYSLRFCTEMNCTLSFESDAELEEHMLSGLHTVAKSLTSLDKVRNSFVHKMKITSQLDMPISSSSNSASVKDKPHCMNIFLLQGWALPVRSSFRFSNQQKELLYKYFIRGEESGNKMSPEQVHMQLRRELPPDQYVTSQQIRSLFSRFSNLKRKGKLVEPTTENNENSQVNDNKEVYGENDDFNLTGDNEDDNKYEEDIANLAKEICLVWKVNDWVAVTYEKQWNIGYIVEVSITGIRINCMINGQEKNTFRWPVTTEKINNQTDKIICLVNAPFLISGCGDYSLSEEDYNTVISLFLEKLTAAE